VSELRVTIPPAAAVLCLASASPRRRELLWQIGVPHLVVPAAIDEEVHAGELAEEYVLRVARAKARRVAADGAALGLPVLGADTSVIAGARILGKPRDAAEAEAMLASLSGSSHIVLSAVALAHGGAITTRLSESTVRFRATSAAERRAYCRTGEPYDKAGGYAIQGFAAVFVEQLSGSFSGVMGLPLCETAELLRTAGIPYWTNMAE
jgi:septum formation protein